ncbi:MAG: C45 family peptidase [Patescibacteria group bacterium]
MRFIKINAKDHYEAGYKLGKLTTKLQKAFLKEYILPMSWDILIRKSRGLLKATKKIFPQYIDEIHGLANGADISFEKLWVLHCIDEIVHKQCIEKCSSIFVRTDTGYLIGHNEDWESWTKEYHFMQERTINGKTVLELNLAGAICGGTVSINSYGLVQTINTLYHTDFQIGVPKSIIARWLSGMSTLENVKNEFPSYVRAAGYCYNLALQNKVLSIESSAHLHEFIETHSSYIHTNHYTGTLTKVENESTKETPSFVRYNLIKSMLGTIQNTLALQKTLLHTTEPPNSMASIYRSTEVSTIASLIFDIPHGCLWVTQENKGIDTKWYCISLDFLKP